MSLTHPNCQGHGGSRGGERVGVTERNKKLSMCHGDLRTVRPIPQAISTWLPTTTPSHNLTPSAPQLRSMLKPSRVWFEEERLLHGRQVRHPHIHETITDYLL